MKYIVCLFACNLGQVCVESFIFYLPSYISLEASVAYYTPTSMKLKGGYTGITLSVCPSVRLSLLHWLLLDISSASAVYIQYLNYAITVPADDMTPVGVMSSAGTVVTNNLHIFYKNFFVYQWCKIAFVDFSNNGIPQLHKYEYFEL